MRMFPWMLVGMLAACGSEAAPPAAAVPATIPTPTPKAGPDVEVATVAANILAGTATAGEQQCAAEHVTATVGALLGKAAVADLATQARAPAAIMQLGTTALPALTQALANGEVKQRRLAALTLLQWGEQLHQQGAADQVIAALTAAKNDPDLSVRAAAEHALLRATGDTTALDKSRAENEAARQHDQQRSNR